MLRMYVADVCCGCILRDQYTAKSNLWNVAWAAIIAIYCKGNILHSKYIARPIHSLKSNLWNGLLLLQYTARPHLHFGQNPVTCVKFISLQPREENSKSEYAIHHRHRALRNMNTMSVRCCHSTAVCVELCAAQSGNVSSVQGSVKTLSLATQWKWMRV